MSQNIINYSKRLESTIENPLEGVDPQKLTDADGLDCIKRYIERDGEVEFINFKNYKQLKDFITLVKKHFSNPKSSLDWNAVQEEIDEKNLTYKIQRKCPL